MARALGQRWTARLLAAMLSLALVFASLFGAAAHAGERTHHSQHRHQSQVGQHHGHDHAMAAQATSAAKVAAVAVWRGPQGASVAGDIPEPDGSDLRHGCCMDFICHGCMAIVAAGTGWQVTPWHNEARTLTWDAQGSACVRPSRLDRPPKPLVSA